MSQSHESLYRHARAGPSARARHRRVLGRCSWVEVDILAPRNPGTAPTPQFEMRLLTSHPERRDNARLVHDFARDIYSHFA